jgi:predicted membrane metal-binding protein
MTHQDFFSTRNSDCERFLSAPLWVETSGAPLSVMSAFARLGLEPWAEADRLRQLPLKGAVSALAASLSRLPVIGTDLPDYAIIATRLVALLPQQVAGSVARKADALKASSLMDPRTGWWLAAAAIAVMLQVGGYRF